MFAGIGDPIFSADHMVNCSKLSTTHLALNFINFDNIIPIVIIHCMYHMEKLLEFLQNPNPKCSKCFLN